MFVHRRFEIEETKSNLFGMAKEWLTMKLAGPEEEINYENEEEGLVVGLGIAKQKNSEGFDVVYDFKYEISIKIQENQVTGKIETMYGTGMVGEDVMILMEAHLLPRKDYEELQGKFHSLIGELESYVTKGSAALKLHDSALARFHDGDYEGAVSEFTKAVELHPGFPSSYDSRGIVRRYMGDWDGAMADHTIALDLNPKGWSAYNNRGNLKTVMGDWEGAVNDYTKAAELGAMHPGLFNNLALAKSSLGDYEGAIRDYTKVIELAPIYPDSYNSRGWLYIKLGQYQEALNDIDKALSIDEKAMYYDSRGWACFYLNMLDEARRDALAALELDPATYFSKALLYRIEVRTGNADQALEELKKFLVTIERKDGKNQGYLLLQYFAGELPLEYLKNDPYWDDLKVALKDY
jgi:tetratricopeptide (TPR) repeat protein